MGNPQPVVRLATASDTAEISRVLALAFDDDPMMLWMLPVAGTRQRRLRRMFLTIFRHEVHPYGGARVALDDGRIVAVALWIPPRASARASIGRQLMAAPGFLRAFGTRVMYGQRWVDASLKTHPHEPHWYLYVIGVDPARQGKGFGAALLRERLAQCDAENLPAYLESSNPVNGPLYEHFGFKTTGVVGLPADAPEVPTMWREPQRQLAEA